MSHIIFPMNIDILWVIANELPCIEHHGVKFTAAIYMPLIITLEMMTSSRLQWVYGVENLNVSICATWTSTFLHFQTVADIFWRYFEGACALPFFVTLIWKPPSSVREGNSIALIKFKEKCFFEHQPFMNIHSFQSIWNRMIAFYYLAPCDLMYTVHGTSSELVTLQLF